MRTVMWCLLFFLLVGTLYLAEGAERERPHRRNRERGGDNSNTNNPSNGASINSNSNTNNAAGGGGGGGGGREGRQLRRSHRSKFPLRAEEPRRKSKRTSECRLGRTVHEIGDTWNPDLGEPFGVMYCIQCACESVQKKRRIVGRIRCRNLKSHCPKVECSDAISVPGQCCKICPEMLRNNSDKGNSDGGSDDLDSNENNNREYAALLTPRSSTLVKSSTGLGEPMTGGLGAGRFIFMHKSLYYSFVHNEGIPRPKFVQFVDPEGNVVEEQEVSWNSYQSETRKICGVWMKIPRIYRKLLKEEKLFAALVTEKIGTDNDRYLAGRVAKQKYVTTELYSSLLEPAAQHGTGGMAVITVSPSTGSIYLNVLFNGDFTEERDITITTRIADASGSGVEESVTIPKIQYESNSIEVRTILELEQLNSLSRGTLFIVVYSPKNPEFKLIGFIQARHTCDIFDSVLGTEENENLADSALAWVYPLPDTRWAYNFYLPKGHTEIKAVKLETGRKVLEELPILSTSNRTRSVVSGMTPRYYSLLYEGNIYLNVVTNLASLRGRLSYRGFGDAQLADSPLLLESSKNLPADLRTEGLLWLGIDGEDCGLNYQLTLNKRPQSDLMRLELMEMPGLQMKGLPVRSYTLDNFEASEHDGVFNEVNKMTFAHMKAGDVLFRIVRVNDSSTLASASMKNIRVPSSCLPSAILDNVPHPDYTLEPEDDASLPLSNKCYYDGQLRDEYSQWQMANDSCTVCTCYKGQTKCDSVVCPAVDCVNPVLLTGECCRTCLPTKTVKQPAYGERRGCSVEGDRFHPAGSTWHPYIPPNGFMVCTTCTCDAETLSVHCTRQECPRLNCAPDEAVYPRPLSCCKVCPVKKSHDMANDDHTSILKRGPTEGEILAQGGCKARNGGIFKNGEEWNHRIEPFGEVPCVVCNCRSGMVKCGRKQCPQLTCDIKIKDEGECCPRCATASETSKGIGLGPRHRGKSGSSNKHSRTKSL